MKPIKIKLSNLQKAFYKNMLYDTPETNEELFYRRQHAKIINNARFDFN
jgi:hypothetical protein